MCITLLRIRPQLQPGPLVIHTQYTVHRLHVHNSFENKPPAPARTNGNTHTVYSAKRVKFIFWGISQNVAISFDFFNRGFFLFPSRKLSENVPLSYCICNTLKKMIGINILKISFWKSNNNEKIIFKKVTKNSHLFIWKRLCSGVNEFCKNYFNRRRNILCYMYYPFHVIQHQQSACCCCCCCCCFRLGCCQEGDDGHQRIWPQLTHS